MRIIKYFDLFLDFKILFNLFLKSSFIYINFTFLNISRYFQMFGKYEFIF